MFCNKLLRQPILRSIVVLVALMNSSCESFGSKKLLSSHSSYNDAVQLAVAREVLANIVRSRYTDPIQFIAVSNINAQFSVNITGSAGGQGIGQAGATGSVGGSASYSDSPTITFTPQSDAAFYNSIYSPFSIEDTAGFAISYRYARANPSWQTLLLILSYASINHARDFIEGKISDVYLKRVDALVRLVQLGGTFHQVPEWDFDTSAVPKAKITGEDRVDAFNLGLYFIEEGDGENLRLARYRMVLALVLPSPKDPKVIAALEDLGVTPGRKQYILRPPMHAIPGVIDPFAIWVTPRSMVDMINITTRFVEVPAEHRNIIPGIEPLPEDLSMLPSIRIRSSTEMPSFAYRIQHRGYWFYVDDSDIETKMFFDALVAAFSSRVGSKQADDSAPQLVLPVGGG